MNNDNNRPTTSPAESALKDNGQTARGRIPLPQRTSTQDNVRATGQVRFQPPGSRLSTRDRPSTRQEPSPAKQRDSTAMKPVLPPARRQSIVQPCKASPPSPRRPPGTRSPVQPVQPPTRRPLSPRKTDMLPPPRPNRSNSLKQPVSTGTISPVARGHARHRSQMTPNTKQVEATPTKRSRAISTFQRPSSPKKFSKPPTPTPGDGPQQDNLLIPSSWPDISALQTELLQLSLLHSSMMQKQTEWKLKSESHLRNKYEGVATQYQTLVADETKRQYELNVHALGLWQLNCREHRGPHDFTEQIQILSQVPQDISDMIDGDGDYSRAVKEFETWLGQAELVRQNRESGYIDVAFVDPLPQSWKEPIHTLHAKLELCLRQLQVLDILGFGQVERLDQSAVARVATTLSDLMQLMLQEIRAMRILEVEVVRSERESIALLASRLAGSTRESRPVRVGVWRC